MSQNSPSNSNSADAFPFNNKVNNWTALSIVGVVATVLGFILEPYPAVAWFALATPFVVALSGGHLHGALTVFPVNEWSSQVSQWIGG